jgi:hypothetical protein
VVELSVFGVIEQSMNHIYIIQQKMRGDMAMQTKQTA